MCFQIVSDDHEFRLALPFEAHVEERLCDLLRSSDNRERDERLRKALSRRFVDLLTETIDRDMLPPTPKQTDYAVAIARELNLELPADVLCFRDAMTVFLSQHVQSFRERKAARLGATVAGPKASPP